MNRTRKVALASDDGGCNEEYQGGRCGCKIERLCVIPPEMALGRDIEVWRCDRCGCLKSAFIEMGK